MLITPFPEEREAFIEHSIKVFRAIAGTGFPFDKEWHRKILAQGFDRAFYPKGPARHLVAILTQKNRRPALKSVSVPTLVVHGADDPLVPVECGRNVAADIPGAELMIIDGMGHDMPHGGAWPQIIDAVVDHTHKVDT